MSICPHCGKTHEVSHHFCPTSGQPIELGPRLVSHKLLERFRVVTILGEGPISIVVEVEEEDTGRRLAAKLIHPYFTRGNNNADNLLSESKQAGNLGCKHIAEVVETGRDTGQALTVVRELMTGQCLEALIEEEEQLPIDQAIKITREILTALDAIHSEGLMNLDLSPADIFLAQSEEGEIVKLVDLGEHHVKLGLTLEGGDDLESRNYYAPEQFDRSRQINLRSDLYAAGAILYQMVTGEIPKGSPTPVSSKRPDIDDDLILVIQKSIDATPNNRYQTASEFIAALDGIGEKKAGAAVLADPEALKEEPRVEVTQSDPPPSSRPSQPLTKKPGPVTQPDQPSVIVNMGTVERQLPFLYSKTFRTGIAVVVILVILGLIVFFGRQKDGEVDPNKVVIAVQTDPESASVTIDGRRIDGNPVMLEVEIDSKLHTVKAKANGFEPLERDIKFDQNKFIELNLVEIVKPDDVEKEVKEPTEEPVESPTEEPAESPTEEPAESPTEEPAEKPTEEPEADTKEAVAQPVEKPKASPPPKSPPKKAKALPKKIVRKAKPSSKIKTKPPKRTKTRRKPKPKPSTRPKIKAPKKKSKDGFNTANPFG